MPKQTISSNPKRFYSFPIKHVDPTVGEHFHTQYQDALAALNLLDQRQQVLTHFLRTCKTATVPSSLPVEPDADITLDPGAPARTALDWSTAYATAHSLRTMLAAALHWALARREFIDAIEKVGYVLNTATSCDMQNKYLLTCNPRRHGGWGHHGEPRENSETRNAERFHSIMAREAEMVLAARLRTRWNQACSSLDDTWTQSEQLVHPSYPGVLPLYKDLKKTMPVGGRLAYSVLMAVQNGCLHNNEPDEHMLFGWCCSKNVWQHTHLETQLREAIRQIPVHTPPDHEESKILSIGKSGTQRVSTGFPFCPGGKAPSLKAGIAFLSKQEVKQETGYEVDRTKLCQKNRMLLSAAMLCGEVGNANAGMILYLHQEQQKLRAAEGDLAKRKAEGYIDDNGRTVPKRNIPQAIVRKILGWQDTDNTTESWRDSYVSRNSTPTIILDTPVSLGRDDYYAPCLYTQNNHGYHGDKRAYRGSQAGMVKRLVRGYVLLRKHWPDMIHVEQLPTVKRALPAVLNPDGSEVISPIENLIDTGILDHAAISTQLDSASRSYFDRERNEEERKLTANQRIARLLRRLRTLPALTRDDSYSVSNCKPGTETFIQRLQLLDPKTGGSLERTVIDGKRLAVCWKVAKYPEVDRFGNVINSLHRQAITNAIKLEAACSQALVDLVLASDYYTMDRPYGTCELSSGNFEVSIPHALGEPDAVELRSSADEPAGESGTERDAHEPATDSRSDLESSRVEPDAGGAGVDEQPAAEAEPTTQASHAPLPNDDDTGGEAEADPLQSEDDHTDPDTRTVPATGTPAFDGSDVRSGTGELATA